jgi:hypothetical protein
MEFHGIFFHNDNIISVKKQEYLEVFYDYFLKINKDILICCPLEQAKKFKPNILLSEGVLRQFVIFYFLLYLHSRISKFPKKQLVIFHYVAKFTICVIVLFFCINKEILF